MTTISAPGQPDALVLSAQQCLDSASGKALPSRPISSGATPGRLARTVFAGSIPAVLLRSAKLKAADHGSKRHEPGGCM